MDPSRTAGAAWRRKRQPGHLCSHDAGGRWYHSPLPCLPQAGQQPVPGPCDGPAGQRAEWEGLSHSEDQVTRTQETPSGVPTCCIGSGAPFPSSSLLNRPGVFSRRGAFEVCGSGCTLLVLPIPESSRGSGASSVRRGKGQGEG